MLITLLQSGVSLMSNSWLVYVGVLFITMVIFAPNGIMGLVLAHRPDRRAPDSSAGSRCPISGPRCPALLMVLGFVGLVELTSFLTIGAAQGKTLVLFGNKIDMHALLPWLVAAVLPARRRLLVAP